MTRRFTPLFILIGLLATPAIARPAEEKAGPGLVVRFKSWDALRADAKYLGALVGQEEMIKQFDGLFKGRVGEKGLAGIDTKRPLGLYASMGPNGIADAAAVVLVPISDEKEFLDLLEGLDFKAEKGKDGVYTVDVPNYAVYFRFANKYVYATAMNKANIAKDKLLKPEEVLPAKAIGSVSATIRLDQLPDGIKEIALGRLDMGIAAAKEKKEKNETEAARRLKEKAIDGLAATVGGVIKDGGELSFRVDIDQKKQDISVEVSFAGKEGSKLAAHIAEVGESKSLFGALLGGNAATSGLVHTVLPEEMRKAFAAEIDAALKKELEKEKDAAKRKLAEKLFKALTPSLKAGELDAGFTLRGPSKDGHYALVVGVKVKDGELIDKTAREVIKELPKEQQEKIELDAESAGDVNIHELDLSDNADKKSKQLFGDSPLYMAVRSDAWFFAIGEGSLELLKESLAAEPKASPSVAFNVSVARLAPIMELDRKGAAKAVQEIFGKAGKGNDTVRFTIEGGKALTTRFTIKAPVITFLNRIGGHTAEGTFSEVGTEIKNDKKKPKKSEDDD